jgi:hypothetical protein
MQCRLSESTETAVPATSFPPLRSMKCILYSENITSYTTKTAKILLFMNFMFPHRNKQTPWPESFSEQFRPSDHRLSVELVPTFEDRGVSHGQRGGSHTVLTRFSGQEPLLFYQEAPNCTYEDGWTPFQTHYFSENVVAPEIEPEPLDV